MNQLVIMNLMKRLLFNYENLLRKLDKVWDASPSGSLHIKRQCDTTYYTRVFRENNQKTEIPIPTATEEGTELLQELIEKRTVYHARPILRKNIKALEAALTQLSPYEPELLTGLLSYGELKMPKDTPSLPDTFFLPGQLNVQKWIDDTLAGNFRLNPHKPEKRKIPTADGHLTRSKSEELWCDILAAESLLYRYDSDFRLASGRTVYPDFTVLHQRERRLIRIEHFGLMDDPKYAIDQLYKLEEYAQSGLLPGRDLFFTVETKDRPLTRDRIYEVLDRSGLLTTTA